MNLFCRYFVSAIIALAAVNAHALDPEVKARIESNSASHERNIEENKDALIVYQEKLEKAKTELEQAKYALGEANKALVTANVHHSKNATPENFRLLKKATDLEQLAEKKVSLREKRLERAENKLAEIKADTEKSKRAIERNKARLVTLAENAKAEKIRQAQEEKRRQAAAEKAKQEAKKRAVVIAKPTPVPQKVVAKVDKAPTPTATPKATPKPVVAAPAVPTVKSKADSNLLSELDNEEYNYYRKRVGEFNEYLAEGVSPIPKLTRTRALSDTGVRVKLEHLGGEIYRGEQELRRGNHTFSIGGSNFRISVDRKNSKKTHVFYLDNRVDGKRRLVVYEKSILENP